MADSTEDLEYHLKFPSSADRDDTKVNDKEDFVFVYNDEKKPVVILFGWAGCQDKHLAKYSAIYESKGCITLRCAPPAVMIFLRHDKLKKLGEKLLNVLRETSLDGHPIFFHIFSNGGAFFYQNISLLMQKKKVELDVKGVIFDSAPGERRFYSVYRALVAIIGGPAWYNLPVSFVCTLCLFAAFIAFAFIKALLEFKKPQTDPITLAEEPFNWPQLFIYSRDDELVSYKDIEKFAAARERKKIAVKRLCFISSPHVQHLLTHREIYINTVMDFMQECLKGTVMQN